ncbi:MAG TPA: TatD family hydrolase [Candidatus Paceibacterota bacterium]|jgi:TatD DNase family protein
MTPKYVDVHSHLQFPQFDEDRIEVLARMKDAGVWTLTVGTDLERSRSAIAFANGHDGVFATIGLHPNSAAIETFGEQAFEELVKEKKVVGVGECGLDYYRNNPADEEMKKRQHEVFEKQVAFALKHDKPLMLHCRPSRNSMDAYRDVISLLKGFPKARGNVHFFVGNIEIAKGFLELGFTVSLTGVITFAREYDGMVKYLPLDSMLTETDAPYAAPLPYRGKRNEPTYVVEVVNAIARIRSEQEEIVRNSVLENAIRLFRLSA